MYTKSKYTMPFLISNIVLWGIVVVLVQANLNGNVVNKTTSMNETVGYLACIKGNRGFEYKQLFEKKTAVILFNGVLSGKFTEKMEQYPKYRSYLHICCEIILLVSSEFLNGNRNNFSQTASNKNLNESYDILNCIEQADGIRFQKMNNIQDGKFFCKIFPDEKNKQNFTDKNTTKSSLHAVSIDMKINRKSVCPDYSYRSLFIKTEFIASIGNSTAVESNGMDPFDNSMNIPENKRMDHFDNSINISEKKRMDPFDNSMNISEKKRMDPFDNSMNISEKKRMGPFDNSMDIAEKKTNDLKLRDERAVDGFPVEDIYIPIANNLKHRDERAVDGFPVEDIYIPIGGLKDHHRRLRHIDACSFPTTLETAEISCKIYPSSTKCVQRCAFGYTLDDGIHQKMECKFQENKWVPKGFKECQPFVDCTLSLISGGSSKCSSMSLTRGTECTVECLHYEDKPAVPATTYRCDIEGKWDPVLPFCVISQSGLALVKAPKIKLHDEIL